MDIRLLHPSDIPHVQQTNITNLPENYFCKYYMYHALTWPQLSYVAVDVSLPFMASGECNLAGKMADSNPSNSASYDMEQQLEIFETFISSSRLP